MEIDLFSNISMKNTERSRRGSPLGEGPMPNPFLLHTTHMQYLAALQGLRGAQWFPFAKDMMLQQQQQQKQQHISQAPLNAIKGRITREDGARVTPEQEFSADRRSTCSTESLANDRSRSAEHLTNRAEERSPNGANVPQSPTSHPMLTLAHPSAAPVETYLRPKNTSREVTAPLKAWLEGHITNPYPSKADKIMLAITTRMTLTQVSTWFANARRRLKKESGIIWSDDDDDDDDVNGENRNDDVTYEENQRTQEMENAQSDCRHDFKSEKNQDGVSKQQCAIDLSRTATDSNSSSKYSKPNLYINNPEQLLTPTNSQEGQDKEKPHKFTKQNCNDKLKFIPELNHETSSSIMYNEYLLREKLRVAGSTFADKIFGPQKIEKSCNVQIENKMNDSGRIDRGEELIKNRYSSQLRDENIENSQDIIDVVSLDSPEEILDYSSDSGSSIEDDDERLNTERCKQSKGLQNEENGVICKARNDKNYDKDHHRHKHHKNDNNPENTNNSNQEYNLNLSHHNKHSGKQSKQTKQRIWCLAEFALS